MPALGNSLAFSKATSTIGGPIIGKVIKTRAIEISTFAFQAQARLFPNTFWFSSLMSIPNLNSLDLMANEFKTIATAQAQQLLRELAKANFDPFSLIVYFSNDLLIRIAISTELVTARKYPRQISKFVYYDEAFRFPYVSIELYVWLIHCQKIVLAGVGLARINPQEIGRQIIAKAFIRMNQGITSWVSG